MVLVESFHVVLGARLRTIVVRSIKKPDGSFISSPVKHHKTKVETLEELFGGEKAALESS